MAQPEKRENSVLFSLRELRKIEDERVQEETDAQKKAEDDRVRAQQDAERRQREEEQAARSAAEAAERNRIEMDDRRRREEELRLAETEARARVEAQARLEEQRLKMEMQVKHVEAANKKPKALLAVAGVLVVLVVGLGIFLYQRNEASKKKEHEYQAQIAMLDKKIGDSLSEIDRLQGEEKALYEQRLKAKDIEEQQRIDEEIKRKERERVDAQKRLEELRNERGRPGGKPHEPPRDHGVTVNCDPNDPLCGVSR